MTDLLAARCLMALSLGFHILFAAVGIAMPLMMAIAEGRWLRTGDPAYLELARRWARGTAILFAVGAVSGTVLSFELGLLWPTFMAWAGPLIGMPFSLEGFAFFLEGIFIGVYLYGWNRVSPVAHWLSGWVVALSGALSGIFVVTANAWMNTPSGFRVVDGRPVGIDPLAAMMNPAAFSETLHMTLAAYVAVGFVVAAIHARALARDPSDPFHRHAFAIAIGIAIVTALLQPISGDLSARHVAEHQPVKLAAMEGQFETERGAPLRIGGWPDIETRTTRGAIEIPKGLSLLARHDANAEIRGLNEFPRDEWPPVAVVHVAFQVMVACGSVMAAVAALGVWHRLRGRRLADLPGYRRLVLLCSPLGFVAIEAGWTVTEVGRQPWIIRGIMRTADAVTPLTGLVVPLVGFTLLYLFLGVVTIVLLRRLVFAADREA